MAISDQVHLAASSKNPPLSPKCLLFIEQETQRLSISGLVCQLPKAIKDSVFLSFHPAYWPIIPMYIISWLQDGCCSSKHHMQVQGRRKGKGLRQPLLSHVSRKQMLSRSFPSDFLLHLTGKKWNTCRDPLTEREAKKLTI